ncbi:MAG: acyl carrier protein [Pseudomonadota bacterium]
MTETMDIEKNVISLLKSHVGEGVEVTLDTNIIGDTKLDSVAVMDFVMELEDELDITIPLNRLADVKTVSDLLAAIKALRSDQ